VLHPRKLLNSVATPLSEVSMAMAEDARAGTANNAEKRQRLPVPNCATLRDH
jgi:hypothetical protein